MAVTVFWVPIIPLGTKKMIVCSYCNTQSKIKEFPLEDEIPLSGYEFHVHFSHVRNKRRRAQPPAHALSEPVVVEVEAEEIPPPPPPV
jgi:hypothetical protein